MWRKNISPSYIYWLVVYLSLWKMMEFVSWDYYPQYMEKPCSKPPTRLINILLSHITMEHHHFLMKQSPFLMGKSPFLMGKTPFLMGKSQFLLGQSPFYPCLMYVFPCDFSEFPGARHPMPSPPGTAHRSSWPRHDVPRDELRGTGPGLSELNIDQTYNMLYGITIAGNIWIIYGHYYTILYWIYWL